MTKREEYEEIIKKIEKALALSNDWTELVLLDDHKRSVEFILDEVYDGLIKRVKKTWAHELNPDTRSVITSGAEITEMVEKIIKSKEAT